MNTRSPFRHALLAAATLLLAGCQMTTFATAPIAAGDCDPGLAGRWLSMDEDPAKNGEVVLVLDDACQLVMEATQKDGVRRSEPTPLHLGQHGLYRYAWVDARWALAQADEARTVAGSDVYLLRLARDGDRLTLWTVDDKGVAHAIIDGQLTGEVVAKDRDLVNRLTDASEAALLDHPGLFKAEPVGFLRQRDEPE